jgi:hypothetical protein
MPQETKIQGIPMPTQIKNGKPTPLMSETLKLLQHHYEPLSFSPTDIKRFERIYWKACELCRAQFDKYEKEKKYLRAAKKITDEIILLINSINEDTTIQEFKKNLTLCILNTFSNMECVTKIQPLPKGKYLSVQNETIHRSAFAAIYAKELKTSKIGTKFHKHKEPQSIATVTFRPPEGTEVKDTTEYAVNIFKDLDDLTTDTLLLHMAHAKESQDENGFSWLMSATILNDRGREPTKRSESGKVYQTGHRTEDIDEIYRRVQQLEAFWIKIKKISTVNGKKLKTPAILEGRLLTVSQRLRHENSKRVYG